MLSSTRELIARFKSLEEACVSMNKLMGMSSLFKFKHKDLEKLSPEELKVKKIESSELLNYLMKIDPDLQKKKNGLKEIL